MRSKTQIFAVSPWVVLELLKPITWFPPMWAFVCGVVSTGLSPSGRWPTVVIGVILAGPLVCGCSQAVNDWYDRHVDAINEPNRPIPSGRLPGQWGYTIAVAWTALSLVVAATLGSTVFIASLVGLGLAWIYSAPPLRLKENGWWGNAACSVSYEGLAWVTGAAVMAGGVPSVRSIILAALYSLGAHGIMTLNDFKSIEGDKQSGIGSLPVRLGVVAAGRVACLFMAGAQWLVVGCLAVWGLSVYAAIIGGLVLVQMRLMQHLLKDPARNAPWYNGTGVLLFVIGMLISAIAIQGT